MSEVAASEFAAAGSSAEQLTTADISIVVPVGGAAPAWPRCCQSLARLEPPPGEIIAVIDGVYPNLAKEAERLGARVVQLEQQGGPAKARNEGTRHAKGEILFFLDSDIEVPAGLIAQLVELVNARPEWTAMIGSYDDAPGDPGFLSQYRNLLHHFVHQNGRELASTFWSGCGAVRRSAFLEVGGFDESYTQPSIEDIELGSRLLHAGHSIGLVKQLQVKHLKRWQLAGMLSTDLWRRAVPWTELMLDDGELVNDLNVKTRDRLSVVLSFLLLPTLLLPTLLAGWLWPPLLGIGVVLLVLLVVLNYDLLAFFARSRGVLFSLGVLPLYWLYFLICGLGFALGLARHLFRH